MFFGGLHRGQHRVGLFGELVTVGVIDLGRGRNGGKRVEGQGAAL